MSKIDEDTTQLSISVYDEQCLFLAPQFIFHPSHFRLMTLKLSLDVFVSSARDLSCILLSVINRRNNKKILMQLA